MGKCLFIKFLIQRPVTIIGLQHGGGKFAYISEIGEDIEEQLADTFYGWGLSINMNQRQHRYSKRNNKVSKKSQMKGGYYGLRKEQR